MRVSIDGEFFTLLVIMLDVTTAPVSPSKVHLSCIACPCHHSSCAHRNLSLRDMRGRGNAARHRDRIERIWTAFSHANSTVLRAVRQTAIVLHEVHCIASALATPSTAESFDAGSSWLRQQASDGPGRHLCSENLRPKLLGFHLQRRMHKCS